MWEVQYKRTNGEWVTHQDRVFNDLIKARRYALNLRRISHVVVQIVPASEYEALGPQKVNWKKEGF